MVAFKVFQTNTTDNFQKKKCINNPKQKLLEMCDSIPIAPQVDNDKQQINKWLSAKHFKLQYMAKQSIKESDRQNVQNQSLCISTL